ncbi:universal stress protein [Nocardia sp. NPDC050193]
MKTIVTGMDGNPTAACAAQRAARPAEALDAELHVVCAYERLEIERFRQGNGLVRSTEHEVWYTAVAVVRALQARRQTIVPHAHAIEGKPGEVLVRVAEQRAAADLIVVGNKRVQGFARVLGSVARDVASRAHCDVYVAHTHGR